MNDYAKIRYKKYTDKFSYDNYSRGNYEINTESTKSWIKPFISVLCVILFCLLAIVCFMVGRIWERYNDANDFLKLQQQKKIEYNTNDYKIYKNYKYSI